MSKVHNALNCSTLLCSACSAMASQLYFLTVFVNCISQLYLLHPVVLSLQFNGTPHSGRWPQRVHLGCYLIKKIYIVRSRDSQMRSLDPKRFAESNTMRSVAINASSWPLLPYYYLHSYAFIASLFTGRRKCIFLSSMHHRGAAEQNAFMCSCCSVIQ